MEFKDHVAMSSAELLAEATGMKLEKAERVCEELGGLLAMGTRTFEEISEAAFIKDARKIAAILEIGRRRSQGVRDTKYAGNPEQAGRYCVVGSEGYVSLKMRGAM